jgi:arylsulfatase A
MKKKLSLCVAFSLLYLVSFSQKTKNKPPNIILIMADDIGFETISSYGSIDYQTPRIDKMAREGMRFDQCYSQPLCTPSRIQMMTGKSNFRNYERWGYITQKAQ